MSEQRQREREQQERELPIREQQAPPVENKLTVKIAVFGKTPVSAQVPVGSTLGEALQAAGVNRKDLNLRVNGRIVKDSYKVQEYDIVTLLPQIRGGVE